MVLTRDQQPGDLSPADTSNLPTTSSGNISANRSSGTLAKGVTAADDANTTSRRPAMDKNLPSCHASALTGTSRQEMPTARQQKLVTALAHSFLS